MLISEKMDLNELADRMGNLATREDAHDMRDRLCLLYLSGLDTNDLQERTWWQALNGLILDNGCGKDQVYDGDAVENLMDDDLREEIHSSWGDGTRQDFLNEYCRRHREKFGSEFIVN